MKKIILPIIAVYASIYAFVFAPQALAQSTDTNSSSGTSGSGTSGSDGDSSGTSGFGGDSSGTSGSGGDRILRRG